MKQGKDVLQPVDESARRLARSLVRSARFGVLASLMPDGRTPLASRVLVASSEIGEPLLLVSQLAAHAGALAANPSCSILFGEPGAGDPLASPRIGVFGQAEQLDGAHRAEARARFLARHPFATTYCDFADFRFLRVGLSSASLNAGFARAYALTRSDLVDTSRPDLRERLARASTHMNEDHGKALNAIAGEYGESGDGWRIVTADTLGFELAQADRLLRIEFVRPIVHPDDIRPAWVMLAKSAQPLSPIA